METRERDLQRDCDSVDELCRLTAMHELAGLRQRYLAAKGVWVLAKRDYDKAVEEASVPWRTHCQEIYREAALKFLRFLEDEAVPANQATHEATEAAQQAGLHVEQLTVPALFPDAVQHRCRVGRQGLG